VGNILGEVIVAVNKSCAAGNANTVELLYSKFGPSIFDVNTALRKARLGKNRTIITFLEDIKSAQTSGSTFLIDLIFGVLVPLSTLFQLYYYHGDQF
jgi:hypothetical protein